MSFSNMLDFKKRIVVITGACGLIGRYICKAFMEFNATVIAVDIMDNWIHELIKSNEIHYLNMDIGKPEQIEDTIQNIIRRFGKIHSWINTAYPRTEDWGNKIEDVSFESWDKNIRMHLGGYFWSSKCVLEQMKADGGGCLINFGSIYGSVGPNFHIYDGTEMTMPVAYAAIKGAIANLTRYFATLYGPSNIRVNCIAPGGIENEQPDQFVRRYSALTPMRRMGKPYEMAMPTVFLASDAASYISGQILMIDGGWTIQ